MNEIGKKAPPPAGVVTSSDEGAGPWLVGALLALSCFWAPFVLVGIWMTTTWKHRFDVDVEARLPTDAGRARDLLLVIGVPCAVAAVVAVVLNLGGRRSRIAVVGGDTC